MSQDSQLSEIIIEEEPINNIQSTSCLFPTSRNLDHPPKPPLTLSDCKIIPEIPVIKQELIENEIDDHIPNNRDKQDNQVQIEVPQAPIVPIQELNPLIINIGLFLPVNRESIVLSCPICYGDYNSDQVIELTCHHSFCKECIESYLKSKIDNFQPENIKCPQADCPSIINGQEIWRVLDKATHDKYQNFLFLKAQARNYRTKYCPQPGCARALKVDATRKFTTCECGVLVCNECFHVKHDGKTCAEILKDQHEPFLTNRNLKMCLICKTGVEKWTGCPKIQCPICDYTWCWDCGREYSGGHASRCSKIWDPKPPKKFTGEKASVSEQFWTATVLLLEIVMYYIVALFGIVLMWPFLGCILYQGKKESRKFKCFKLVCTFIGCLVTWPIAIVVVPVVLIADEYFNFCKKKRWLRGGAKTFGVTSHHKASKGSEKVVKEDGGDEKKEGNEVEIAPKKEVKGIEDLEKGENA